MHRLCGGDTPASWQRAALVLSCTCVIVLVIPVYLLVLELFGERLCLARLLADDRQPGC